jgi:DNA polymerase elongation subunit (family B)
MPKNSRYRLSDFEIQSLKLERNTTNRYRLNREKESELFELRKHKHKIKRLFFDIETSQYEVRSFRIGYNLNLNYQNVRQLAKIICISYSWGEDGKIQNLHWDKNQCDKQMLIDFIKILDEADEIVAHNGDRFDIKWIRTRAIYHRIPMRAFYKSFDTLKKAKSNFNFPNNRLDTIAQFLGVGAKVEHDGMKMWDEVQDGNKHYLKEMVKYCDGDIVVLRDVFFAMQNYTKPNTHIGVLNNNLKYSCPCCGSEQVELIKNNVTAMGTIKRLMGCLSCGTNYEISNSSYINYLKFKIV